VDNVDATPLFLFKYGRFAGKLRELAGKFKAKAILSLAELIRGENK